MLSSVGMNAVKFNDGEPITNLIDGVTWGYLSTPAFYWPNNESSNKDIYGGLYNWFRVDTGKLVPIR